MKQESPPVRNCKRHATRNITSPGRYPSAGWGRGYRSPVLAREYPSSEYPWPGLEYPLASNGVCPSKTGIPQLGLGYHLPSWDWGTPWPELGYPPARTRYPPERTWDQRLGYLLERTFDQRLGYAQEMTWNQRPGKEAGTGVLPPRVNRHIHTTYTCGNY